MLFRHLCTSFILFISLGVQASETDNTFHFALIGDLPYGVDIGKRDADYDALVKEVNAQDDISWVLHVGDIKTGGEPCSDALFKDRAERLARFTPPFTFTPGDNEWTDCHRALAGGYDPLERLTVLREIFYESEQAKQALKSLGIIRQSEAQPEYSEFVENQSWAKHGVRFASFHIVGSHNGRDGFSTFSKHSRTKAHDEEVTRREKAVQSWLNYVTMLSEKNNERALFLIIHANPGLDHRATEEDRKVFDFFMKPMLKQVKSFDGPVVLAHGDSHYMRLDKPQLLGKDAPANFLRLESFGENNGAWIKVSVDPDSEKVFSFQVWD